MSEEEKLSHLSLINIEQQEERKIELDELITDFAKKKSIFRGIPLPLIRKGALRIFYGENNVGTVGRQRDAKIKNVIKFSSINIRGSIDFRPPTCVFWELRNNSEKGFRMNSMNEHE
ncbi:hypothetical protein TNCV_4915971 [Trichonephila clavipes]|nr:hypothetical protein TNCV_4915971 [Trichonephila clavipes]